MIQPDLTQLMQEAEKLQKQFKETEESLKTMEIIGESGAGLVTITMNGSHDVKNTSLDDDVLKQSKEVIEGLITAAINDAVQRVDQQTKGKLSSLSSLFKNQLPSDM